MRRSYGYSLTGAKLETIRGESSTIDTVIFVRPTMSKSRESYRVTLSNNQVVELQQEDIDVLKQALEDDEKSIEVTLPGEGHRKMTIYVEHVVSIEATGLVRRGIGFI